MQERVKRDDAGSVTDATHVNLAIDSTLAAVAAAKGIDLAAMLEHALRMALEPCASGALTDADRSAIAAHRSYEAALGSWGDDWGKY